LTNTEAKVSTYAANDINTANRLHLLVMLYDSAVKFMALAIKKLDAGNIAEKGMYVGKAIAIISEFRGTLDYGPDPELAKNLDNLYIFINDNLLQGNIKNDRKQLENALRITVTLREGWVELEKKVKKGEVPDIGEKARSQNENSAVRISV
jgi:flagellar secretion chaperone FliS